MRHASPTDRRLRLLTLTPEGDTLPAEVQPGMLRAQARRLLPLPPEQRGQFMEMLKVLVDGNTLLLLQPHPQHLLLTSAVINIG